MQSSISSIFTSATSPLEDWLARKTGLLVNMNAETLLNWQLGKAWESVAYARSNSAFYSSHLPNAPMGGSIAEWQCLPMMDASDILKSPKSLLCVPQRDVARVVQLASSGTMQQKNLFFSENDLESTIDFFAHGMSTMVEQGQKTTVFMRGQESNTIGDLLQKGLERIGVTCEIAWPVDSWEQASKKAQGAHCLVGLPAFLLQLALRDTGLHPKIVLLSADYVPESIIDRIRKQWGCTVLTHYGLTETCYGGGVQCMAQEGYHMRHGDFLFEVVDPQSGLPVKPGQHGEVVLTTLPKRAMPLVRYRTGDLACLRDSACSCGGRLPQLGKVCGRLARQPALRETDLNIHSIDEHLFAQQGVWDYRAVFDGGLQLMIYAPNGGHVQIKEQIRNRYPDASITFVDHIPLSFAKRQIEA